MLTIFDSNLSLQWRSEGAKGRTAPSGNQGRGRQNGNDNDKNWGDSGKNGRDNGTNWGDNSKIAKGASGISRLLVGDCKIAVLRPGRR